MKRMKLHFVGVALTALVLPWLTSELASGAGRGTIKGTVVVTTPTGDRPVSGARVSLFDRNDVLVGETTTDVSGSFTFHGLENGRYEALAERAGLGEGSASVTVRNGLQSTVRIVLD
jgi:hypothetical protein